MFDMTQFGKSFCGGPLNGFDVMIAEEQRLYEMVKDGISLAIKHSTPPDNIYHNWFKELHQLSPEHRNHIMRVLYYGEEL